MQLWRGIIRSKGPDRSDINYGYFCDSILSLPRMEWCARRDLNPQPSDPKSDALSIELRAHSASHQGKYRLNKLIDRLMVGRDDVICGSLIFRHPLLQYLLNFVDE